MLSHKTNLNKCKGTKIIQIFPDHNWIKLETNNRRKFGKFTNMWKVNNMLLNNQWIKEEIARKIRRYFKMNEKGNPTYQNLRDAAKVVPIEKFIVVNVNI